MDQNMTDERVQRYANAMIGTELDDEGYRRMPTVYERAERAMAVADEEIRKAKAEALREVADLIEETPWEVFSSEGPLDGSDDRTWLHGTDCAIRFATRLTRLRADEIEASG